MATAKVMVIPEHNVSGVTNRLERDRVYVLAMSKFKLEVRRNFYVIKQSGSSFEVPGVVKI